MLSEEYTSYTVNIYVRKKFDCEKICLERGIMCVGVNVIVSGGSYYTCSLISEIPTNITNSMLLSNINGKFLVKTTEAVQYCQSLDATVVTFETLNEFQYVITKLQDKGNTWTSAKRYAGEELFNWVNGVVLPDDSPMWYVTEPSNGNSTDCCVMTWSAAGHRLDDTACYYDNIVLCEQQP
ncbi:hypothetical protein LSH36_479g00025 [Paralvinella palmiformis]|uniref:C-type lectin domain-containing protein n=1 Tax=Paralvinella palmiformis TaxID=53620 RepID=A0AAD9J976_9ANNE|nr:hypothetical protein LSH36_479g00025 [Paralvinella palmiformis]